MSSSQQVRFRSLHRLQEIPVVHFLWEKSTSVYHSVRSLNILTLYGFLVFEKSVQLTMTAITPVVQKLERPIEVIDSLACVAVDKLQDSVPLVKISPEEALNSTSQVILENGLVQKSLNVVDKTLFLAEKAVTVLPNVQVEELTGLQGSDKEKKEAMDVIAAIQKFYAMATTPLSMMGDFLHQRREKVKSLQISPTETTSKRRKKQSQEDVHSPGIIERLLFLPVQGLHNIGQYAEKRSELRMLEDPDIDVNDKLKYKNLQDAENREIEELNFSNSDDDDTDSETEEITDVNRPKELTGETHQSAMAVKKDDKMIKSSSTSNSFT